MAKTDVEKPAAADAIAERLANRDQEETVWQSSEPLRRIADAFREQVASGGLLLAVHQYDARRLEADDPAPLWQSRGLGPGVMRRTLERVVSEVAEGALRSR